MATGNLVPGPSTLFQARFQNLPAQLLKVDADDLRRLRHQRMAGHAGRRVDFEQVEVAGAVAHEVDAAPAGAAGCLEGAKGQLLSLIHISEPTRLLSIS